MGSRSTLSSPPLPPLLPPPLPPLFAAASMRITSSSRHVTTLHRNAALFATAADCRRHRPLSQSRIILAVNSAHCVSITKSAVYLPSLTETPSVVTTAPGGSAFTAAKDIPAAAAEVAGVVFTAIPWLVGAGVEGDGTVGDEGTGSEGLEMDCPMYQGPGRPASTPGGSVGSNESKGGWAGMNQAG